MAVLPSAERDTNRPCQASPTASEPTKSAPCLVQTPPLLVQTLAAPPPFPVPPTMAVLPSAERDPASPCDPEPTSLVPCWLQTPPLLVQTHAAPPPSQGPPTMAVLPSAERDTDQPCPALITVPVPTNFGPCCENCARAGWEESSVAQTRTSKRLTEWSAGLQPAWDRSAVKAGCKPALRPQEHEICGPGDGPLNVFIFISWLFYFCRAATTAQPTGKIGRFQPPAQGNHIIFCAAQAGKFRSLFHHAASVRRNLPASTL